ncbi:MAG: hypothetical protein AAF903_05490 [Pseudomonadota bacterium]
MRPNRWTGLDWWHRTAIVAFVVTGLSLVGAFGLSAWLDNASRAGRMGSISWIALSIFPLFMVLAVALLGAAQRGVNMRMGQTHRTKAVFISTARREEDEAENTGQVEILLDEHGQPADAVEKEAVAP